MNATQLANLFADVAEVVLEAQRALADGRVSQANLLRVVARQMLETGVPA